jgi:nucleotide-binding universal stress UspA family protein
MQIRRILCATAFSVSSERALDRVVELAQGLHSEIHLLHVYQRSVGHSGGFAHAATLSDYTALVKLYMDALEQIASRYSDHSIKIVCVLAEGPAWEIIVSKANELNADMIVIGRNGRAGLAKLVAGSAALRGRKIFPCPGSDSAHVGRARIPFLTSARACF